MSSLGWVGGSYGWTGLDSRFANAWLVFCELVILSSGAPDDGFLFKKSLV